MLAKSQRRWKRRGLNTDRGRNAFTPPWEHRNEETRPVPSRHAWSRGGGFAEEISLDLGL